MLLPFVALMTGCFGSDRPETFPVRGTVTYRGKPVGEAHVQFISKTAPPATGITDASGHFSLRTFEQGDGAVAGEHTVLVTKNEQVDPNDKSSYPAHRSVLPVRYGRVTSSPLTATVAAEGDNEFPFDLTD